jgi:hypothetical protein
MGSGWLVQLSNQAEKTAQAADPAPTAWGRNFLPHFLLIFSEYWFIICLRPINKSNAVFYSNIFNFSLLIFN